jgi:thiamine biosynthesis lipoprotein
MIDVLVRAQVLHRMTRGAFEPAVLPDLEAAGYDRSFELVSRDSDDPPPRHQPSGFSISQVEVDLIGSNVTAPPGLRLDLGGIGKGYAVDAAATLLEPARNFVVNAGGDMFASGAGPDGDGWLAAIVDPFGGDSPVSLVRLYDQALATSTTAVRRWRRDGRLLHHLIDPQTGRPAESGVLSASVMAPTATEADVFAKTAVLLGVDRGLRFLRERLIEGMFVLDDASLVYTDGWRGTRAAAAQGVTA